MNTDKTLVYFYAAVAVIVSLVSLIAFVNVSGKADYCYIERATPWQSGTSFAMKLVAHRPWRIDRDITIDTDYTKIMETAKSIGCDVRSSIMRSDADGGVVR